ncbi:protein tramtrack, alpha isoform isoform X2 [Onthophagus taurus]|uniref:protein tramtrack, alpha isoform isoform X2 n=1 Tax=Onthophagus taurus TaxID=166361 RepID=UPI000C20498F|nr:protein tramtrack, alpha isoform-like isoform X2 [Onthophagus taurus]
MNSLCYRYQSQYQSNVQQVPNNPLPNMSSQRFCLRWNNHQSNLLSVFDQLLHDESFVDVTLAVDGKLLRAHKMVLSACSPYFQTLFVNHPDKDPIVILKDVPYNDMKSLLDFMYRGEVSVDQDRLTAFLKVAESLRIKGLTEVNEEKCDSIALTQNQHHGNAQLQRFMPQKRFANSNMLSNALMQPKRKRGRPRKLSGSSNGTPGEDFDRSDGLVQGSPELLEVKMGMDGFTGNHSDSSSGKDRDNDLDENCKDEEPTAGTSKETSFSNSISKSENDFSPADSPGHPKLLTPKIEMDIDDTTIRTETMIPTPSLTPNSTDNINNNNNPTTPSTSGSQTPTVMSAPSGRQPVKRRARRRATSQSQDPAEQLTEMSVRGLNLFRYAQINEGVYHCTECAKVDVQKTFKNKYSFQRHAFLYHEGHQRKVFPCPVCQKEFSRPDKMKNHMKTVHDCFMPKDCVFPLNLYLQQ